MPVEYTNRKGDVYYLHEGRTPTGKPKFFFSKNPEGAAASALPCGYEVYETPEYGLVYVRKAKPAVITPLEREVVCDAIRRRSTVQHFIVDIQKDSLVVYLPALDERELRPFISEQIYGSRAQAAMEGIMKGSPYTKMMRFELVDRDKRLFHVCRWCFSGGIDDWIFLDGPAPLGKLADKYVRHLGQESFFELN